MNTGTTTLPLYALGNNPGERARLQRQADDLASHTKSLLEHVGVSRDGRALELGCGPAGSIEFLAHWVGPAGFVTAVDIDPAHVALARRFVADRGLHNVEVVHGDARATGLPCGSFDLVHARLLLVNIPSPERVIAEMVRVVKPGGWVVTDEADAEASMCYPPHDAWDQLRAILHEAYRSDGADLFVGRKLTAMLRSAGLVEVGTEARADVYPAGHPRRTLLADLVLSMREKLIERKIVPGDQLADLDRAIREHLADPGTLTMSCLYFLAWGRKQRGTRAD